MVNIHIFKRDGSYVAIGRKQKKVINLSSDNPLALIGEAQKYGRIRVFSYKQDGGIGITYATR